MCRVFCVFLMLVGISSQTTIIPNLDAILDTGIIPLVVHCATTLNVLKCLKKQAIIVLDDSISDNRTWPINSFVEFVRNPDWSPSQAKSLNGVGSDVSLDSVIMNKLTDLAQSRAFQFKLDHDDELEGRKKKGGKGGMMVMSGIAIMGFAAQLFMSKIAFLAAASLLLSKIALFFTLANKKTPPPTSDHVVYADHAHPPAPVAGGWQRSIYPTAIDSTYKGQPPPE